MRSCVLLIPALIISSTCVGSDFDDLVNQAPSGGNALMAIDVTKTLASPIARANGWDKKLTEGGADRPLYLPPDATSVLTIAKFDIVRDLQRSWDVALFNLAESVPLKLVARVEGGYVDTIDGTEVVWIPSDAYIVKAGEKTLAMQGPANRQAVAGWLSSQKSGAKGRLSDYLSLAVAGINRGPQVVLAFDTEHALQVHRIRQQLEASGFAKAHSLELEPTAELIAGMRGIVTEITFTDKATARTKIDFSQPVSFNKTVAKALVLAALEAREMSLPALDSSKFTIFEKSIIIDGELNSDSLRRLLSLMEPPSTKFSSLKDANVEEASGDDTAANSLAYFKSTQSFLKDLRQEAGSHNSDAYWIERYASKIDHLPILHVDDDLLDYGQKLTETLRVMSGSRKMTNLQGAANARNELGGGGYYDSSSGYGYGDYNYSTPKSRAAAAGNARTDGYARGTAVKIQGWELIDNATTQIRREMTKRYNMEF